MKIDMSFSGAIISFRLYPDTTDNELLSNPAHLAARGCYFEFPFTTTPESIHPDLLGLSALLLCYPFTKKFLELSFSVSSAFADLCDRNLNIELRTPSGNVRPRIVDNGVPALAYSGGIDSTAALSLMPDDKVVYFIDRVQPYNRKTLYDKSAALAAINDIKKIESCAHQIRTDMEYLRNPVGFPLDPINADIALPVAVPALLMADEYKIDSVAIGAIMDAVYKVGYDQYENYLVSKHYEKWAPIFSIVGVELFFPVAGITEVGTTIINKKIRLSPHVRACMRGDENNPCGKCVKCFRKNLLAFAVERRAPDLKMIESNLDSLPVVRAVYGRIPTLENIYRYVAANLPESRFQRIFFNRLVVEGEDTTWMERWFPDSIDLVPAKYRITFLQRVLKHLNCMTSEDISFIRKWDSNELGNKEESSLAEWKSYVFNNASEGVRRKI